MMQLTSEQLEQYTGLLEEADKAFTGKIQRDAVAQAQADIFFQLGMRDKGLMQWGLNSIATAKGAYSTAMMDIVSKFEAGTYDSTKAFSRWRNATKRAMETTYRGGAASVGNPFYKDLKIPMRDQRLMARYLNKEGKFFKGLLHDIKDPNFRPASQIPRDAKGKILPGYKMQHFSFQQRAGMYPESMKAMRYNGALMGAGSNIEIRWVLGAPMTKHCPDCPQLAARVWTPETLPTVPGAGDTQCIYRCYCSLEIRQKARGREFDLAGRATEGAIRAVGKNARVYDARGNEIGGVLQADIEAWTAEMNRARQMVSVTTGDVRMDWIMRRKQLNRLIIDRAKVGGYRVVPTTSVRALVDTVKTVAAKGGSLVDDFMTLRAGQEVWLVRGDYSSFGVMGVRNGRLVFKSPTGVILEPIARTDIMFSAKKKAALFGSKGGARTAGKVWADASTVRKQRLRELFGENWEQLNIDEFAKAYVPKGYNMPDITVQLQSGGVYIYGNIHNSAGQMVGRLSRMLNYNRVAVHNSLTLFSEFQNVNIGKLHFKNLLQLYDDLGVKTIRCYANGEVGKYAWAKYGYDFETPYGLERMKELFHSNIQKLGTAGKLSSTEATRLLVEIDGFKHSWDFASFTHKGQKLGKEYMLRAPGGWDAVLDLSPGSTSRKLLEDYLGGV